MITPDRPLEESRREGALRLRWPVASPRPAPGGGKTVSFNPKVSTNAGSPALKPQPPTMKRRRSSLKQGIVLPHHPPREFYQHPDPLIRRLRLRNGAGSQVRLVNEFRGVKVVLFLFGGSWPGSSKEPYEVVSKFVAQHEECRVVYVSVDSTLEQFESNTRGRPFLAMDFLDGSNLSTDSSDTPCASQTPAAGTAEPFLLAGDRDLEDEVHLSDLPGSLYLRPYSRVFLAEKWQVLGVPNLAVYHLPSRQLLTAHAKIERLSEKKGGGKVEWAQWSKGEKVVLGLADYAGGLKWALGMGVAAASYLVAVRWGGQPDFIGDLTESLGRGLLARPPI